MKTKLFLLSFLMLFTFTANYAQTSASEAGIAVQGIARDSNNTAIASQDVNFKFEIYYNDGQDQTIYTNSIKLTTDAFGVFSYVLEVDPLKNGEFANRQLSLRITANNIEISDEPLRHVPYAISANNGVPTGAIMPFVGAGNQVPIGWVLCNGDPLPSSATKLIAMIGVNTPNLGGMFLRGAGVNSNGGSFTGNDGPALNEKQNDKYFNHNHKASSGDGGAHSHVTTQSVIDVAGGGGGFKNVRIGFYTSSISKTGTTTTKESEDHTHPITVNDSTTGGTETRPVNYGVNYIIKL